jgi:hypothetical protein
MTFFQRKMHVMAVAGAILAQARVGHPSLSRAEVVEMLGFANIAAWAANEVIDAGVEMGVLVAIDDRVGVSSEESLPASCDAGGDDGEGLYWQLPSA